MLALAVILLAAVLFVLWLRKELAIDRCHDQGGRWNAGTALCEGTHRASAGPALAGLRLL